jgi:hypothetical protein
VVERAHARALAALAAGELLGETDDFDCVLHDMLLDCDDVNRVRAATINRGGARLCGCG